MKVKVKLFATLRKGRFESEIREYPPNTTIKNIVHDLKIPEKQAAILFINNKHAKASQELRDNDVVAIFPLIGGG